MTTPSSIAAPRKGHEGLVLAIACVAQFMVVLDVSIVNVALPSIGTDLNYSPAGLQWVVNAYVLTFAGFLLLGGRAADLFGRKKVFLIGLAVFTLGSLLSGLAMTSWQLTAFRALQGVGGAILSPATLTIIVTTFQGPRLPKAIGAWSAVAGAGGAVGSLLGGILTSALGWRWVFFINIPIGIAAGVAGFLYLTELKRDGERKPLDILGAIAITAGLASFVYGVVNTPEKGWTSPTTLVWIIGGMVLIGAFIIIEQWQAKDPLVPFRIFRSRSLSGANIVMLLVGAAFFAMWYFLTLYMQDVLGFSVLKTGFAFAPQAIAIIIGAQISSRLVTRLGVRTLMFFGTAAATVGFFGLSQITSTSTYWGSIFGPAVLVAFALGILFTPLATAATAEVDRSEAGLASGVLNTARQVGGSLGLAVLATIALSTAKSQLAGLGKVLPTTRHCQGALCPTPSQLAEANTTGYARAFAISAMITAVAFFATFVVPKLRQQPSTDAPVAVEAN